MTETEKLDGLAEILIEQSEQSPGCESDEVVRRVNDIRMAVDLLDEDPRNPWELVYDAYERLIQDYPDSRHVLDRKDSLDEVYVAMYRDMGGN